MRLVGGQAGVRIEAGVDRRPQGPEGAGGRCCTGPRGGRGCLTTRHLAIASPLCCLLTVATSAAGAGDPIPLDTPEPKYQDYFNKVRERIKAKWVYPRPAAERGIEGEVLIEFHIAKDGRLEDIALQRSSGVPLLDTNAMNAVTGDGRGVKFADPFPPVPDELLSWGSLAISVRFRYQIVGSFVNMLLR
jgi:TonB family protein